MTPGVGLGLARDAGGHACVWGTPPMCAILGMGAHGNQSDGTVAMASSSCWQPSLAVGSDEHQHPHSRPCRAGVELSVMSLPALVCPGDIHLSGCSVREGASRMSHPSSPSACGCAAPGTHNTPFRAKSCPASGEEAPAHQPMLF